MPGRYADFAVLSDDYFTIDMARIPQLSSVLTVVDGKVVHAEREFASLAPPPPRQPRMVAPVAEGGGTPAAGANGTAVRAQRRRATRTEPGTDACRARGPGRRFARPRYPTWPARPAAAATTRGGRCVVRRHAPVRAGAAGHGGLALNDFCVPCTDRKETR